MHEALTMLPFVEARRRLGDCRSTLSLLRPPYAALGCGTLRVMWIRERADVVEVLAGYDRYERLPA